MKILFAITKGETGGAQEHLRILVEGMAARGHEIHLLVQRPSDLARRVPPGAAEIVPWHSIVRDIDPRSDLRARQELHAAVSDVRPDVLHLHSSKAGALGRGIVPKGAGATIFTCHHLPYGPGRMWRHRLVGRLVDQLTLRSVDSIISVGTRDIPTLRRVAPGVPVELVRNAVPERGGLADLDRPVSPTALWVARMKHPKDPVAVVKAWSHVVRERPDARLVLCGDGPLSESVRRAIERLSLTDHVAQLGMVPDLANHYARSSIYVLASTAEGGVNMATLEAMTHGLVPVVTDAGDARLLLDAGAGVVVPRVDPVEIATAVLGLLNDPARVQALRRNASAFSRRWTTDQMVDATLAVYERTLARSVTTAVD